jgi:hypothetical protein
VVDLNDTALGLVVRLRHLVVARQGVALAPEEALNEVYVECLGVEEHVARHDHDVSRNLSPINHQSTSNHEEITMYLLAADGK